MVARLLRNRNKPVSPACYCFDVAGSGGRVSQGPAKSMYALVEVSLEVNESIVLPQMLLEFLSRAYLVVPASVMGTSRKHRFNSRRYSGLAGKIWVTPRYIVCLVFRIFSGETACVRRPGWQPSSSPGALRIHLLIRSHQPLLPKCLKQQK